MSVILTPGQVKGVDTFFSFYMAPLENVMLLEGYSGTGKSTLVRYLVDKLPELDDMRRLIDPEWKGLEILQTASTNQAAVSLASALGGGVQTTTIHSALGLRLIVEDYRTKKKKLIPTKDPLEDKLIFVDEASFIDQVLLGLIIKQTKNCKLVFVGDPCQLTPVGSNYMPAFKMDRNRIELTDLVRFDDGPITTMVNNLRDTVLTQTWHKFQLAPDKILHVPRNHFEDMAKEAFRNKDHYGLTKMLAFHNDAVVGLNHRMALEFEGSSDIKEGGRYFSVRAARSGEARIFNNEEVLVESLTETSDYGFKGWEVKLTGKQGEFFMPYDRASYLEAHRLASREDDFDQMQRIDEVWVDLRHEWACTVNKAQGSTYDTAFVDLSDIYKGARTADQLARLLYVANSRCRSRIIMTGDLG